MLPLHSAYIKKSSTAALTNLQVIDKDGEIVPFVPAVDGQAAVDTGTVTLTTGYQKFITLWLTAAQAVNPSVTLKDLINLNAVGIFSADAVSGSGTVSIIYGDVVAGLTSPTATISFDDGDPFWLGWVNDDLKVAIGAAVGGQNRFVRDDVLATQGSDGAYLDVLRGDPYGRLHVAKGYAIPGTFTTDSNTPDSISNGEGSKTAFITTNGVRLWEIEASIVTAAAGTFAGPVELWIVRADAEGTQWIEGNMSYNSGSAETGITTDPRGQLHDMIDAQNYDSTNQTRNFWGVFDSFGCDEFSILAWNDTGGDTNAAGGYIRYRPLKT